MTRAATPAATPAATSVAERLRDDSRFKDILGRLVEMSERDYYNPYRLFDWPESLPDDMYWMSPELMVEHGTAVWDELSEEQRKAVSKWQSINFYSLNVHGIRELLHEIVARIHTSNFDVPSEYFHHIIGEENEHMWFFARFCRNYGKIYPLRAMQFGGPNIPEADHFLVFSRLLIFEEVVDVFNQYMAGDERLHPTIRKVNEVHHQDESRHIAFGRQIVAMLHADLRGRLGEEQLTAIEDYLRRYMRGSVDSLCEPGVYRDAGVAEPYAVRRRVLADPGYPAHVKRVLRRTESFMLNSGIMRTGVIDSTESAEHPGTNGNSGSNGNPAAGER